jgi:TRAP-type C4-dicarboxylate transport system substrate-binding protein
MRKASWAVTSLGCLGGIGLVALAVPGRAAAEDTYTLRLGTVAPDGSELGRNLRAFTDEVAQATGGHLKLKWYFNGVAGDELEQGERIAKGQLDGSAGGQMLCNRLIPSMMVTRLPGVFQSRDEAGDALDRLKPTLDREAHERGFVLLSTPGLGPDVIFTKTPVRSMAELRKLKLWRWDLDEVGIATSRAMGLQIVPLPLGEAARAYDEGRVDGFLAIPLAALSFQWSARARYVTDLRGSYIWGCFVVTDAAYDRLPAAYKRALQDGAAKARERFEESGRRIDEALLGGLFARQGVRTVPTSEGFRAEYMAAARDARERVAGKFIPQKLMDQVMQMLADYRLERPAQH